MSKSIAQLQVGESAIIKSITDSSMARSMMTMGILPNKNVRLVRKAPFGDSLYLEFDTHMIALRGSEAAKILIW